MKKSYVVTAPDEEGNREIVGSFEFDSYLKANDFLKLQIATRTYLEIEQYCTDCHRIMCNCICD